MPKFRGERRTPQGYSISTSDIRDLDYDVNKNIVAPWSSSCTDNCAGPQSKMERERLTGPGIEYTGVYKVTQTQILILMGQIDSTESRNQLGNWA